MASFDGETHPLVRTYIDHIENSALWRTRWRTAHTAEELIGLLDCGLRIPDDDKSQAIIWYLRVADSSNHPKRLAQPNDDQRVPTPLAYPYRTMTRARLRQMIGYKAWEVLARDYFSVQKLPSDDGDEEVQLFYGGGRFGRWSPVEYTESGYELLERLLLFFDPNGFNLPRTNHYPHTPGVVEGKDFVIRFAQWILDTGKYKPVEEKNEHDRWRNRIHARGFKAIPQAVHLLSEMRAIHKIRFLSPSAATVALPELWKLAFRFGSHYLTIEEAAARGNDAAEVYMIEDLRLKYPKSD